MKKIVLGLALSVVLTGAVFAEPLMLEQAGNVLEIGSLRVGADDAYYSHDLTIIENAAGVEVSRINNNNIVVPLHLRYAFNSCLEGVVNLPYVSSTIKQKNVGYAETKNSIKGLGDLSLGAKCNILKDDEFRVSLLGIFELPTGAADIKQGLNIEPGVAVTKALGVMQITGNAKYNMTGEYTDSTDIKHNFGDITTLGLGAEYPIGSFSVIGEIIYETFGDEKTGGLTVADSGGSRTDFVVGSRHNGETVGLELGVAIALGDEAN